MLSTFNTYLNEIDSDMWRNLCREYGTLRSYRKGEEFITIGEVAKYFGFIKEGSLKYVVQATDGKEKVIGLETVGGYGASFPYCLHDIPSKWSIIANTDSEIYCLPVEKIKELIHKDYTIKGKIEETLEHVFYTIYDRHIELYALSPKERYEQLLKECPPLFDIFQLKDIASYLNITPAYLRKLRRKG